MNSAQQWYLFGYDMRQLGALFTSAWRDLLWRTDSPLRRQFDEVVLVERADADTEAFQSGHPVPPAAAEAARCRAICLPDEQILHKTLTLPAAAEPQLASALAIEVNANSPFPAGDTAWGWQVRVRDENSLTVELAIVSRSSVMGYLADAHQINDRLACEVWAQCNGVMVVIEGFGEGLRESLYRRRLLKAGGTCALVLLLVLAMAAVVAAGRGLEVRRLDALAAQLQRDAAQALEARSALGDANRLITAAAQVAERYRNPHRELARLTDLLEDDAFLAHFSLRGDSMRIRGRATDAAQVMERLSAAPAYEQVTAPQAIVRVGNTGQEQFYLDINLGAEGGS